VLLETVPGDVHAGGTPYTQFIRVFGEMTRNYRKLYRSFAALSTWLSAYEQIAVILPYALVAPRLFAADPAQRFTLGKLVKVSNAFGRVFDSLNVVSDRWLEINEWRSCLRRLREFEREVGGRNPAAPARLAGATVELAGDARSEVVEDSGLRESPWITERQDAGRV
jgi:ABC-type long-subunit fatty acid transport system fused permease/ATPase subunit